MGIGRVVIGIVLGVVGGFRFCVAGTVGSKLQGRKKEGGVEVDKRTQVDVRCQVKEFSWLAGWLGGWGEKKEKKTRF